MRLPFKLVDTAKCTAHTHHMGVVSLQYFEDLKTKKSLRKKEFTLTVDTGDLSIPLNSDPVWDLFHSLHSFGLS